MEAKEKIIEKVEYPFEWMKYLSEKERKEFYRELFKEIKRARENGKWKKVEELLDSWEETAEIESDPELMKRLREAEKNVKSELVVPWQKGK